MLILRYFAGLMVWTTIFVVNVGLIGCTLYSYYLAGRLSAVSHDYVMLPENPTDIQAAAARFIHSLPPVPIVPSDACLITELLCLISRWHICLAANLPASLASETVPGRLLLPAVALIKKDTWLSLATPEPPND